jgi:hypothetical protein
LPTRSGRQPRMLFSRKDAPTGCCVRQLALWWPRTPASDRRSGRHFEARGDLGPSTLTSVTRSRGWRCGDVGVGGASHCCLVAAGYGRRSRNRGGPSPCRDTAASNRGRFPGSAEMHAKWQRHKALKALGFYEPDRPMLHLRAREFAPVTAANANPLILRGSARAGHFARLRGHRARLAPKHRLLLGFS